MIILNDEQEYINLTYLDEYRVLYFSAKWCIPCRKLRPVMQKIHDDGICNVYYIDVDECDLRLLQYYDIASVPSLYIGYGPVDQKLDSRTPIALINEINEYKELG